MWTEHLIASNLKVLVGLGISILIGALLALLRYLLPQFVQKNCIFNLCIDLIRFPPPIVWIPMVILFCGVSFWSSVLIVVVGGMPPVFTTIYDCLLGTNESYRHLCATLNISRAKAIFYVYLPSQWPQLYTSFRISLGMCWMSIVASEMISSQSGLGYLIQLHRINLDYEMILADILLIAVCGYGMNRILLFIEKKHLVWKRA